MRKAQIQGQIFIYILMIVIVVLILIYGYRAIADFGKKSQQIDLIESKAMVRNAIEKNSGYMVIKKVEINLPSPFSDICFVSSSIIGQLSMLPADNLIYQLGYEIIKDSVDTGYNKNMFYFPDGTEAMDVGNIEVQNGFKCFKKVGGVVTLKLRGKGDSVFIEE
jgi:hypothetical protein